MPEVPPGEARVSGQVAMMVPSAVIRVGGKSGPAALIQTLPLGLTGEMPWRALPGTGRLM